MFTLQQIYKLEKIGVQKPSIESIASMQKHFALCRPMISDAKTVLHEVATSARDLVMSEVWVLAMTQDDLRAIYNSSRKACSKWLTDSSWEGQGGFVKTDLRTYIRFGQVDAIDQMTGRHPPRLILIVDPSMVELCAAA